MKKIRKISIRKKLLVVMLLVVLLQGILCFSALTFNGGFGYLKKSECTGLSNATLGRKNAVENFMLNKWSDLDEYQKKVQTAVDERLKLEGKDITALVSDKELNNRLLLDVTEDMVDMLRYNSTTEAYVVLGGYGTGTEEHCGLLIRNLAQGTNDNSKGFLLEVGSSEISRKFGIPMDSYWSSRFILDERNMDVSWYKKPVESAQKYMEADGTQLGYWSGFYRWTPEDIQVMSYSVPLVRDGVVYGVIGATVSEDYLESMMSAQELDAGDTGSLVLARTTDGKKYESVFSTGIVDKALAEDGNRIEFEREPVNGKVYELDGKRKNYGSVHDIDLYRRTSPYSREKWAVIGILPGSTLFRSSDRLQMTVMIAFAASILFGIIGAVVGSYFFTRPIRQMAEEIKSKDVNDELKFKPSDIQEIDALEKAIVSLNLNVRQNASKVSQIIELVNLPLGVIEYRRDSERVFCTKKVVKMFMMDRKYYSRGFLDRKYFEDYLKEADLEGLLEQTGERDYQIAHTIQQRWVHLKSLADEDKTLITVIDITRDIYERQKIEYERDYDILTHLLNRRAFNRRLKQMLREGNNLTLGAMIMWDLDNLKYVNDTYGHDYGDQYIQRAAVVFGGLARDGGIVSRISGDEFLAFVPECESKERMIRRVEQIKRQLNNTRIIMPDGELIAVRASGGIAWYPDDGRSFEELSKYADFAMYDTKNSYKGDFKEFDKKAYEKNAFLLQGKEQLNKLIEEGLVNYAFQPIVSAKDGSIYAYEALMRPAVENLTSPTDVMRLAIAQSRLPDIEKLTFCKTFEQYAAQRDAFGKSKLFINSIPNQILSEKLIYGLFEKYQIGQDILVVEMIESEQTDIDIMEDKIHLLKIFHAELAVDDFGAGYSSESTLLYMQPDYVKIDMSIVRDIHKDKDRQSLVVSTVNYAKPRGIRVIAEGVENTQEMCTLISLGVDYLQGFYIAKPDLTVRGIDENIQKEIRSYGQSRTL